MYCTVLCLVDGFAYVTLCIDVYLYYNSVNYIHLVPKVGYGNLRCVSMCVMLILVSVWVFTGVFALTVLVVL